MDQIIASFIVVISFFAGALALIQPVSEIGKAVWEYLVKLKEGSFDTKASKRQSDKVAEKK